MESDPAAKAAWLAKMHERYGHPESITAFSSFIGFEITDFGPSYAAGRVRYRRELIGDSKSGVVAGGVITALLDGLSGVAAYAALDEDTILATIDLRIDYMRGAEPGKDILATARCIKVTSAIAFVRSIAFEEDPDDPIATGAGAFMLNASEGRPVGVNLKPR